MLQKNSPARAGRTKNEHMKYHFLAGAMLWAALQAVAQTPYPAAPPAPPDIAGIEYFFNADPGFGNGISLPITAQQNINALATSLNIAAPPVGFTPVYLRSRDANGRWSHTQQFTLIKLDLTPYPSVSPNPGNLVRAEYFINSDPGLGNAIPIAVAAQPNVTDQAILVNLNALGPGFYQLGIRTLDASGRWSHTQLREFAKIGDSQAYPTAPAAASNVVAAEYFINTDPGLGQARPLAIGSGANLQNINAIIDISGLPAAIHTLGVRTRNANGQWSLSHLSVFTNNTPAPYPAAPAPATALQRLEYFIDTDPGFGNGIPIAFTTGTNVENLNVSINLAAVPDGQHTLFIRSRNNPYSLTSMVGFVKGAALPLSWLYVRGELKPDGAHLAWATASEKNTQHFGIEHSTNGLDFRAIAQLPAAGQSQTAQHYTHRHVQPAVGMNYYRIKQVDKDGAFTYSRTVALLNRSQLNQPVIAPNPVVNNLLLVLPNAANAAGQLQIVNAAGQVVHRQPVAAGAQQVAINVAKLLPGHYKLSCSIGHTHTVLPFVKLP
ncbi:MAG: T9SS C-terminal target domain-containing protein [Bacteroidetes bacterium]|nr:MAG: T9SS C-terminal target domain-containing protein [Bacteroidota bacterium]